MDIEPQYKCTECGKGITLISTDDFTPMYFKAAIGFGPKFDRVHDLPFCCCICATKWLKENNETPSKT